MGQVLLGESQLMSNNVYLDAFLSEPVHTGHADVAALAHVDTLQLLTIFSNKKDASVGDAPAALQIEELQRR